jgi:hypothetical protein
MNIGGFGNLKVMRFCSIAVLAVATVLMSGCSGSPFSRSINGTEVNASGQKQILEIDTVRQELAQIQPPSKSRYLAVHSLDAWENPYVTVQPDMVTLHVLLADENPSDYGKGGMLRPVGARRQDLNVRLSDLPAALNAIPQDAWPYGRVVAVEEAHNTPGSVRPQVRRNVESVVKMLNDVGVVVDDRNELSSGR